MKVDEFLQVVTVQTITFFGLCVTRGREETLGGSRSGGHTQKLAAMLGRGPPGQGRRVGPRAETRGSPWLTPGTCSNMVWKSWTPLLLLALCKSGADGPSFFSLPPSLESHTLKGHPFFFFWTVGQTGVCRRFLSCHQIPELFTGLCHVRKWPFSDKTGNRKPVVIPRYVSLKHRGHNAYIGQK